MLSNRDLETIRKLIGALLPDTCDVQHASTSVNDAGLITEVWTTVASDVPCRVDPVTRTDRTSVYFEREAERVVYQITLPHDANVQRGDRVITGGVTYQIRQLRAEHSLRATTRALAERVA